MNCDVKKLKGVFKGEIYSIIMPKVTISREVQGQIENCDEPKSIIESQITSPKSDSVPQKREEGVSEDGKNQRKVRFESSEKKRVEGKERKEESENGCASGKPYIECKEKEEMNGEVGDIGSSKRVGIKGFNEEEDKHVLLYTSATVLVLALGVYASYKLRSLART